MSNDKYEEYYLVDILNTRVMNDTNLLDTFLRIAYARMKNEDYNAKNFLRDLNSVGANQILNYSNFNKWYNRSTFPSSTISAVTIPEAQLETIVETKEGTNVTVVSSRWDLATVLEWTNYRLQELYNYVPNNSYLYIDKWYLVGRNHSTTTIGYTQYLVPDFTSVAEVTTEITRTSTVSVTGVGPYTVTTTYFDTTRIMDGGNLMKVTVGAEVTNVTVESVRPEEGTTISVISSETISQPSTVVETNILANPLVYSYIVNYEVNGTLKLWIYFPTLGTNTGLGQINIPTLTVPQGSTTDVELFPITVLRHNYYFINEYDGPSSKQVSAGEGRTETVWKPSTVTEEHYNDTKYILGAFPLDIEFLIDSLKENPDLDFISDTFFMMGIDPFDTHAMTSQLLFESFRYYDIVPEPSGMEVSTSGDGNFDVYRDPFNLKVNWSGGARQFLIQQGEQGTYTHRIYNQSVIIGQECNEYGCNPVYGEQAFLEMNYQITDTIIERITIQNISGITTIGRTRSETITDNLSTQGLIFPLPYAIVENSGPVDKILILERTLRILIYAGQNHDEYLAWYERGVFKVALQIIAAIVAVVVAVVTAGTGAGISAVIANLLISLTIGVGINIAVKIAGTIWGDKLPWIEAVVQAVAIVAMVLTGYIDSTLINAIVTAVDLVNVAMKAVTSVIEADTQDMLEDRLQTAEQYQAQLDSYTEISNEFGGYLDPVDLSSMSKDFTLVKPSEYYDISFNLLTNYDLLFNSGYDNVKSYYKNSLKTDRQYSYT